jgi:hypothetical protein
MGKDISAFFKHRLRFSTLILDITRLYTERGEKATWVLKRSVLELDRLKCLLTAPATDCALLDSFCVANRNTLTELRVNWLWLDETTFFNVQRLFSTLITNMPALKRVQVRIKGQDLGVGIDDFDDETVANISDGSEEDEGRLTLIAQHEHFRTMEWENADH